MKREGGFDFNVLSKMAESTYLDVSKLTTILVMAEFTLQLLRLAISIIIHHHMLVN
jgi:hypothetical protein